MTLPARKSDATKIQANLFGGRRIIASQTMLRRFLIFAILLPACAWAQAQNQLPDPMSLRARDAHQDLTIIVDPYLKADRYKKEIFGKDSFYSAGIVAIDVYFKNDNSAPIRLNGDTIELIISQPGQDRQRLGPLSPEDVADRTLLKAESNIREHRPFPFPGTGSGSGKSKDWVQMTTMLRSVGLSTDVLPPHATTHGFLFFDLNHQFDAIHNSHLYIPDLAFMTDKRALFFFEIDLADVPQR
jgi:hypothetical protein